MKKIILILSALFFMAYESNAQGSRTGVHESLMFGLKVGINSSNVYAIKGEGFDSEAKTGLTAGAFLSIPLLEYVGIQPEFLLSQKGFKATGSLAGNGYEFTRTTTYFDIPVFVTLKPVPYLTILAGPHYSYLMKEKYAFGNASTTIDLQKDFLNDGVRKNSLGFGGGMDVNLDHIVFGARVFWDLQNNNGNNDSATPRYKNTWYQGTLGYRFY